MGNEIARVMNHNSGNPSQQILSVYWAVAPPAVRALLDQIRTALTKLVAELRANTPPGHEPSGQAADQAMSFVVTGRRAKVNVTATQASGTGAMATTAATNGPHAESGFWTTSRKVGAAVVGLATIAGAILTAIQVF